MICSSIANLVVRLVHVENIAVYLIAGVIAVHLAVTSEIHYDGDT